MDNPKDTIPDQQQGAEVNVEESVTLTSTDAAKHFFSQVRQRLLNVNKWKELAGALSAGFTLTDRNGELVDGLPQPGHYFKIDIPAPGIITGEGFDWVKVEEVKDEQQPDADYISIRVRPASSPVNGRNDVAHFLTEDATSTFVVQRRGATVTAGVYGRNETPNVNEADTLLDKARNAIVGSGAVSGLAKLQWKGLVSGLLKRD